MNIEVGKSYQYVTPKGLRPHPNEHIEGGTIVTVAVVMPGGVMLEGYEYPHKAERLQELEKEIIEETERYLSSDPPDNAQIADRLELAFAKQIDAALAAGITIEELIEWMIKRD